jgi:hypothetical protein
LERAERQARREAGEVSDDLFENEDDADLDESQENELENESENDDVGEENAEDEAESSDPDVAPVILTPPVQDTNSALTQKTDDVLKAVDTVAKPVLLAKLAEQLQQRDGEAPAPVVASHDASHMIQEVVLPFVEALRHAEDSEVKKTASHRFLLDVSRMTPADKVMNDDVQNALNSSALEQLGIPEVPMPFDFEGEQGLLNQLVEVAESVVAEDVVTPVENVTVEEVPVEEPLAPEALDESDDDDDDDEEKPVEKVSVAVGSTENLDELIKRKRHALNKQSGLKPKKRTAQNHKKKKK